MTSRTLYKLSQSKTVSPFPVFYAKPNYVITSNQWKGAFHFLADGRAFLEANMKKKCLGIFIISEYQCHQWNIYGSFEFSESKYLIKSNQ